MKIGVVGLGLIGGSIAKSVKNKTEHTVLGMDINNSVVCKARLLSAIDCELTKDNIPECDIIIIALYPHACVEFLEKYAPLIKQNAIVMDCAGVKMSICEPSQKLAAEYGFTFVGAHPMAGIEKSGFEAAKQSLFKNASLILVPFKTISLEQMKKLKDVFDAIGFTHYEISSPEKHDRIIAYTSQLAHVVSGAYIQSPTALEHAGFSAGSFNDMTRVAFLNEEMWTELFMLNRKNLSAEIDTLIAHLTEYRTALDNNDENALYELLRKGRMAKEKATETEQ